MHEKIKQHVEFYAKPNNLLALKSLAISVNQNPKSNPVRFDLGFSNISPKCIEMSRFY
jgi:hypothetical protein